MNKILFVYFITILTPLCLSAQQQDPVAANINGKPILRSELEYAYKKANELRSPQDKESINDFLQSYINMKLNVEEAKSQHLDTVANYKRELSSARVQLSYKYMESTEYENEYIQKIYNRTLENVEINHVLLPFDKETIFPADTIALYKQAVDLRKHLLKNGFIGEEYDIKDAPATGLIAEYSKRNGYVGWVAPFMFPSKVEDAIYDMASSKISQPIRSSQGYHIVQVLNRRPAIGSVELEQVVFGFTHIPPPQHQIDSVGKVAWREYNNIRSQADYNSLCQEFAHVMQTGDKGCYLGVVNLESTMPPSFLLAAFNLEKIGDISQPVLTDYGFHIIRLLKKIPVPEFEKIKNSLRNKILRSDKAVNISTAKRDLIKANTQLSINNDAYKKLNEVANTISPQDSAFIEKIKNGKDILFSVDKDVNYTVNDFMEYIRFRNGLLNKTDGNEPVITQFIDVVKHNLSTDQLKEYFNSYCSRKLSDYYYSTLEKRYPDFDAQMKEFSDGLLLFAVKNKNIWERSKTDEKGLTDYCNKNKSKYKLEESKYSGLILFAKDEKSLAEAESLTAETQDINSSVQKVKTTLNKQGVVIQMEPGSWTKGNNKFVDNKIFGGAAPTPRKDFPFFSVIGNYIDSPQDYTDVQNAVEIDYQEFLDKEWDIYLNNKYKVEIKQSIIDTIQ
ncbi:MAG: peptidylprolyl isomerase [Dysgonomonas sp.]